MPVRFMYTCVYIVNESHFNSANLFYIGEITLVRNLVHSHACG